jgi:hypothetical protein
MINHEPDESYSLSRHSTMVVRLGREKKKLYMEIPLSLEEYTQRQKLRRRGALIQDAYPELNADQREFIKTGITPERWEELFGNG